MNIKCEARVYEGTPKDLEREINLWLERAEQNRGQRPIAMSIVENVEGCKHENGSYAVYIVFDQPPPVETTTELAYSELAEQMVAMFKTKMSRHAQRALLERLWVNHAWVHGLEGENVLAPIESGDMPARVSKAWADGKAVRDRGEGQ